MQKAKQREVNKPFHGDKISAKTGKSTKEKKTMTRNSKNSQTISFEPTNDLDTYFKQYRKEWFPANFHFQIHQMQWLL